MAKKKITQTPNKAVPSLGDIVPLVDKDSVPERTKHSTWAQVIDAFGFLSSADLSGFATEDYVDTALTGKQDVGDYATLVDGLVPAEQLPSYVDDVLEYANYAALPGTGETGKIYVTIDNGRSYRWSGSVYIEINPGLVTSVAGRTGDVVLVKADVGLGNVDNTADASKPVSTLQAAADTAVADAAALDATTKANNAQAHAIQRGNHTGEQAISTVTGLQAAIDSKSATGHTHGNIANDGTIGQTTLASSAGSPQTVTFVDAWNSQVTVVTQAGTLSQLSFDENGRGWMYCADGMDPGVGLIDTYSHTGMSVHGTTFTLQAAGAYTQFNLQAIYTRYINVPDKDGTMVVLSDTTIVYDPEVHSMIGFYDAGSGLELVMASHGLTINTGGSAGATTIVPQSTTARTINVPDKDGTMVVLSDTTVVYDPEVHSMIGFYGGWGLELTVGSGGLNINTGGFAGLTTIVPQSTTARTINIPDADGTLLVLSTVPTTATDPGVEGQIARDSDYLYVCVATDTWKRVPLATW